MVVATYPSNYYEGGSAFRSKALCGGSLAGLVDGVFAGYLISFPYVLGVPSPIGDFHVPVSHPECQYIHDLCVSSWARGLGLGTALAEVAMRGRPMVALTAVMGSEGFWEGIGFSRQFELEYHGELSTYMLRVLRQGDPR
jgi:hypothetical protein